MFTYCHSLPLDYRLYKVRGKVMFLVEPQYLAQGLEHSRQIRNAWWINEVVNEKNYRWLILTAPF